MRSQFGSCWVPGTMLVLTGCQGLYWLGLGTREHVDIDWVSETILVLAGHQGLPYGRKLSWDKILADDSKNENSQIKFSWILATVT